ncbi:MAG: DnaB-like helicase C-terminal domain-containing protein [Candidatus Paceibacterota bacterium]
MRTKFPDVELIQPNDSIEFYIDELQNREKYEALTNSNTAIQNKLFNKDIEGAFEELKKLNSFFGKISVDESITVASGFGDRVKNYLNAKKCEGKIGWQTGFEAIDKHIGGIADEYLVIMGTAGIGKTFGLLMMGKNIWMQMDKPVFLVSNEIAPKKMGGRLDAILSQVNYSKYRKGLLSSAEEKKIAKLKEMYKVLPEFYMTNGAGKNVDDIEFEIMSIDPKPGLLLVDGLYLTDMGFNDEYKNTSTASRAYQRLKSKLGIPLIATTQMTDDFKTKYARAIQEDADAVLYLKQPPNFRDMKRMELIFTKIREEDSFLKLQMNWDFDKWNFSQIKDDDEGDSDSEVVIN